MAQEWAKAFYNSKEWKKCRASYIKSVYGLCKMCGCPGYIVHHIIPLTPDNIDNPEITLNHKLLKYVCKDCHEKFRLGDLRYRFDADGMPIPP